MNKQASLISSKQEYVYGECPASQDALSPLVISVGGP